MGSYPAIPERFSEGRGHSVIQRVVVVAALYGKFSLSSRHVKMWAKL